VCDEFKRFCQMFWDGENAYFEADVHASNAVTGKHTLVYADDGYYVNGC